MKQAYDFQRHNRFVYVCVLFVAYQLKLNRKHAKTHLILDCFQIFRFLEFFIQFFELSVFSNFRIFRIFYLCFFPLILSNFYSIAWLLWNSDYWYPNFGLSSFCFPDFLDFSNLQNFHLMCFGSFDVLEFCTWIHFEFQ